MSKAHKHVWGIDGAHSNEYCKVCFINKPVDSWRLQEFKDRLRQTMQYLDKRQPTNENRQEEVALDEIAQILILVIANHQLVKFRKKMNEWGEAHEMD